MSARRARSAAFITFEGIEGTGKSTQVTRLARRLERAGVEAVVTREPGGTAFGRHLRTLLLRPATTPMTPPAELLLYVADRAQHLTELVGPALARGAVVLCDRFKDATLAYQGYGRGLDLDWIRALHATPPLDRQPDRTVLIDLDPATALARARRRNRNSVRAAREGRFERERLDFHRRVRLGYLRLARAEPQRFRLVRGRHDVATVEQAVLQALQDILPALAVGPC